MLLWHPEHQSKFKIKMKQTSVGKFKIMYRENTSDEEVIKYSFDNDIFYKDLHEYSPRKNDCIIDVGAHIGTFTLLSADKAFEGKVFSFEPCLGTFRLLECNLNLNDFKNIKLFRQALSGQTGKARLYYDSEYGNWGHTITKNLLNDGEDVETISLADFFKNEKINRCNFIKFNCEGAEFDIILSTPPEILRRIDNILVLYHEDLVESRNHHDLIKYLKENGFSINVINQSTNPPRGWIIAYNGGFLKRLSVTIKCNYLRKIRPALARIKSRIFR